MYFASELKHFLFIVNQKYKKKFNKNKIYLSINNCLDQDLDQIRSERFNLSTDILMVSKLC